MLVSKFQEFINISSCI